MAGWGSQTSANPYAGEFNDFVLEIDAREISASNSFYGLIFRKQGQGLYYQFQISGDGKYRIGIVKDNKFQPLHRATSEYINGGDANNHLKVVCQGSLIAAYVNGHHLTTVTDDNSAEGHVGIKVTSPDTPAQVRFDNIKVYSTHN